MSVIILVIFNFINFINYMIIFMMIIVFKFNPKQSNK